MKTIIINVLARYEVRLVQFLFSCFGIRDKRLKLILRASHNEDKQQYSSIETSISGWHGSSVMHAPLASSGSRAPLIFALH